MQLGGERARDCKKLIQYCLTNDVKMIISSFLLFSIILVVENKTGDLEKAKKTVKALASLTTLEVYHPSMFVAYHAIEIQQLHRLDFDDALVVSCMNHKKINHLVTQDKDFDRVTGINVLSPAKAYEMLISQDHSK